jgi:PAS domain S-box-containing protein
MFLILATILTFFQGTEIYLGIAVGIVSSVYSLYKFVYLPSRKTISRISMAINSIDEISYILKPNGGASMSDKLQRIEKSLLYADGRHKILTSAVNVALFETDEKGTCIWVSPEWIEITGIDNEHALENGWINSIHEEEREEIFKEWKAAIEQRREFRRSYRMIHNSTGNVIYVKCFTRTIKDHKNDIIGVVGLIKRL